MNTTSLVVGYLVAIGIPLGLLVMGKIAKTQGSKWATLKSFAAVWGVAGAATWGATTGWALGTLGAVVIGLLLLVADLRTKAWA